MGEIGGYGALIDKTPPELLKIEFTPDTFWVFISLIIYGLIPQDGGVFMQRFLLASGRKQLIDSLNVIAFLTVPFIIIICLTGFIIRVQATDIDPNTAFIHFIASYLPIGLKGFMIAGMLAVIMSTADSWLNYTGVLLAHDILKTIFPSMTERNELFAARMCTCVFACIATILALFEHSILSLVWLADNFWEPLILVPLSAGFLRFRTNERSFICSVIVAVVFTCVGAYVGGGFATVSLIFGVVGSAFGLFGMHYWQKHSGVVMQIMAQDSSSVMSISSDES